MNSPATPEEAYALFSNPDTCLNYAIKLRWPDGVVCPTCGSAAVTWMPTRSLFQCKAKHPRRQFSVKVGTPFEDSPLPLGNWLFVEWLLLNGHETTSTHDIARMLHITQKSAWFMMHRLLNYSDQQAPDAAVGAVCA
jgi:transposase-like protein